VADRLDGHTAVLDTPIGPVSLLADDALVLRVRMGDERIRPDAPPGSLAARAAAELAEYFAGEREEFTVGPDWTQLPESSAHVLATLVRLAPYGSTVSYGGLAKAAGIEDVVAARIAGQILNANPWPILVPCHRVIMSDGTLGGFGSGVWRKEVLLQHEGFLPSVLF
jgi:methylated-DNA-[protein]-cysteine S-methyltransferase